FPLRHARARAGLDAAPEPRMGVSRRAGAAPAVLALCGDQPACDLPADALTPARAGFQYRDAGAAMTTQTLRVSIASDGSVIAVRSILFVATLLLAWVTVNPFQDLANPSLGEVGDTSDLINQVAYIVLAGAVGTYFFISEPWRMRPLVCPAYLLMFGW